MLKRIWALSMLLLAGVLCCANAFAVETPRVVRVGWFTQPGYQETLADGTRYGYNYEYLQTIAQYAGWSYEFVDGSVEGLTDQLARGQIDVIGCLNYTESRARLFEKTDLEVGETRNTLFVQKDSPLAQDDYASFNGLRVAVRRGQNEDALQKFCEKHAITLEVVHYGLYEEVRDAVLAGEVDAGSIGGYQPEEALRVIAEYEPTPFYFFVGARKKAILDGFNKALSEIRLVNPYFDQQLMDKYIPSVNSVFIMTRAETAYCASIAPLTVAYNEHWFPLEESRGDEFRGIVADVYDRVGELTGLSFVFVPGDKNTAKTDILSAMERNFDAANELGYHLTNSFIKLPLMLITRAGKEVKGGKCGTVSSFYSSETLELGSFDFAFYDSTEACFEAMLRDEVDSVVTDAYSASYLMTYARFRAFDATPLQGVSFDLSIAVRAGASPLLLSALNKSLSFISEAEMNDIIIRNTLSNKLYGFSEVVNRLPISAVLATIAFLLAVVFILLKILQGRVRAMRLVKRLLYTDTLTGLANRRGFEKRVKEALEAAPKDRCYVIVRFDVDSFEMYNRIYGFEAGDRLLKDLGERIVNRVSDVGLGARFSADNFICLASGKNLLEVSDRILAADASFRAHMDNRSILVSYGLYEVSDRALPIATMCDRASVAKRTVKGNYERFMAVYDEALYMKQAEDAEMIADMESSLLNGEFVAYYQPQFDIREGKVVGAEALVRWRRHGALVSPDRFIPLFESNGLINRLDHYMFDCVCACLTDFKARGIPQVTISVNFSRAHLYELDFADQLRRVVDRYAVDPALLEIELTETAFLDKADMLPRIINDLHEKGFLVAVDDFGSGFSSLNMLKDVFFDVLKIDRAFLTQTAETRRGQDVIEGVLTIARKLRMQTIAEGVETSDQLDFLRDCGCDVAQGFYYSKPVPVEQFEALLMEKAE